MLFGLVPHGDGAHRNYTGCSVKKCPLELDAPVLQEFLAVELDPVEVVFGSECQVVPAHIHNLAFLQIVNGHSFPAPKMDDIVLLVHADYLADFVEPAR